jgi:hypothetical protein
LRVVIPVFNDCESLSILLRSLDGTAASPGCTMRVCVIDDGSTPADEWLLSTVCGLNSIEQIELTHLAVNVGHQRAIGNRTLSRRGKC